jgi:hypothetical protein
VDQIKEDACHVVITKSQCKTSEVIEKHANNQLAQDNTLIYKVIAVIAQQVNRSPMIEDHASLPGAQSIPDVNQAETTNATQILAQNSNKT